MRKRSVISLKNRPCIINAASVVGKTESEGPLNTLFDVMYPDDGAGSKSWEEAEASLVHEAVEVLLRKTKKEADDIDLIFGGDLLNQCTATTFGVKKYGIPLAGLFGACSTFALGMCLAALAVDGGYTENSIAVASSHFCSAEKQFRYPLEYGGQRAPSAQRTVTGAGACLISHAGSDVKIEKLLLGTVLDLNVTDPANMGAAMAPAAYKTLSDFMAETGTLPEDYDMLLTGDLGSVGSGILRRLMRDNAGIDISEKHYDCGNMIFDPYLQDVHAGGSGCGCSAAVVCSKIFKDLKAGRLKKVLFAGTGALMSPLTSQQKAGIPGIAHAVLITSEVHKVED